MEFTLAVAIAGMANNVFNGNGIRIRICDPAVMIARVNLPQVHMSIKQMYTTVTLRDNVVNGVNWRCIQWVASHRLIKNETLCQTCGQNMRLTETNQCQDGLQVLIEKARNRERERERERERF
ncbi:MAG: hypothetical protein GY820_05840 [Gammaproteobacteria bacterium]|nr:hypothetical protein [Gammaproteobacteria bacterium]